MPTLPDPLSVGGCRLDNRLYRAPLLECAGNGSDAVDRLIDELLPAAAAGAGLIFQGATVPRAEGGCVAPNMTRVHDPDFVAQLERLTETIHDAGGRIFLQLDHGGLRTLSAWHAGYPHIADQVVVSHPPRTLRVLDAAGLLDLRPRILSTGEIRDLAADFGRAAAWAVDAGYDGIHIAGANCGLVQQFLSPHYNSRDDVFADGGRFLELLAKEIRDRAGDVPLVTKIPAETEAPPWVRRHLTERDAVGLCERAERVGFDAVVPVRTSTFWDSHIVRGAFPERAWDRFDYEEAFGPFGWRVARWLHRLQSRWADFEAAWNADLCRRVRRRVDIPVLCEGGIRGRDEMDRLLGDACDAVGLGRPFYAEPRLPARLLNDADTRAVCESCNNCVVPQTTGAAGVCRTPAVMQRRRELEQAGVYAQDEPRGERPDAGNPAQEE